MQIKFLLMNLLLLLIVMLSSPAQLLSQNLVINEIMTLNENTITDEDGDFSDWIELYNGNQSTIQLNGYFLSDDPDQLDKWSIENATIEPDGFLLIFASNKNRNSWPRELHTNFRLSSNGESLIFSDQDTLIIDQFDFPQTSANISIGRIGDGNSEWALFELPTPLAENNSSPTPILIASPPLLSIPSGSYSAGTTLEMSVEEGIIYYSIDGSIPDANSSQYVDGIVLDSVTVIRARCIVPNKRESEIVSATYIVGFESELAIVSLIIDPPNLWDWETGIYVLGPNAEEEAPHYGANFWEDWEIPAFFEIFDENNNFEFSQSVGIKIHGGWSRIFPLKSFRLSARIEYGNNIIDHQLFKDSPINEFERLLLRNSGNDFYGTMFRDALLSNLLSITDLAYQAYRPAVTFINGEYWGVLNLRERIDKYYVGSHFNVDPDNIDLIEGEGSIANSGTREQFLAMVDYVVNNDITETEVLDSVACLLDTENFIQYYSTQIFINNTDWPANNNRCWRLNEPGEIFRWLVYDTDFGFGLSKPVDFNCLEFATSDTMVRPQNNPWNTRLIRTLLQNDHFRNDFIVRLCDMANIIFEEEKVLNTIDMFKTRIEPEISRHINRWYPSRNWESSIDVMRNFIRNRKPFVIQHLRDKFDLGNDSELIINNINSTQGRVRANAFWLETDNFSGTYFDDIPIRLIAEPATGYRFAGWSGDIESENDTLNFIFDGDTSIQPNFEPISNNLPIVIINEINYNSCESFNPGDWIELSTYNQNVDLSGWTLSDGDDSTAFTFTAGTILLQDSFLVIAKDPEQFSEAFVSLPTPIGGLNFGLSSNGDQIILKNQDEEIIDIVEYESSQPWPTQPNGNGPTLELNAISLPNQYSHNWSASFINYGTPNMSSSDIPDPVEPAIPAQFMINKIYPNPFNATTRIEISLPQRSDTKISLYNVLGQFVKEIHSGYISSGTYSFHLNGNDLPSGIYFVQAIVPGIFNQTEKIILLK